MSVLQIIADIARRDLPTFGAYLVFPPLAELLIVRLALRRPYPVRDALPTSVIGIIEVLLTGTALYYLRDFFSLIEAHRLYGGPKTAPYYVATALAAELVFYGAHRAGHRIRWFWNEHRVHHSSTELNLFAGNRNGWTFSLAGIWIFSIPVVYAGIDWRDLLAGLFLILNYQFFVHLDWVGTLGPLEYVLNTPARHRVHHATQDPYLDKNFGGVTVIFDLLFGTLQGEIPGLRPTYGLRDEKAETRLVPLVMGGWWSMALDFRRAKGIRKKVRTLYSMRPAEAKVEGDDSTKQAA